MLYEERRTTLKHGQLDDYIAHLRDVVTPSLNDGEILCLLSAAIGSPIESVLQMTRYADYDEWRQAQSAYDPDRMELVADEGVRTVDERTIRTGSPDSLTTASATLPSNSLLIPERP